MTSLPMRPLHSPGIFGAEDDFRTPVPDHLLQIRCVCRIGPGDAFEIVRRHVKLNGERKDVDNLRGVVSREVRSENSVGAVLKQDLVAAMFFTDTHRRCPVFGRALVHMEFQSALFCP